MDRKVLIAAYWEHYRRFTSGVREDRVSADELLWASQFVDDAVSSGGAGVIELLCDLAAGAPDLRALSYLGAGPVEELLVNADTTVVDAVDAAARRVPRFRTALCCAWFDDHLRPDDARRLRRFGEPL